MRFRESLRVALPAFGVAKVLTFAAMTVAVAGGGGLTWTRLRDSFAHWDAISYLDIAARGYPARLDYHDAFLPGYPLLIKLFSLVTRDLVVAGVVVSALAGLVALVALAELVRRERDAATARFAVWAVALAPVAFFLTGVYTESVFLAGAALSLLFMRSGRMRAAALAAAVATAVRVTGLVLLPVMLVELLVQRRWRTEGRWAALIPLPLVLYAAYMQLHTGDPLAFLHAQSLPSFGEAAAWPWDGLRATWITAATTADPVNRGVFQREVIAGLAGLVLVIAAWVDARFPRSFALYCTLVWLLAVSLTFWRSVPRYDLALFVAVIVVADVTARVPRVRPLLVAGGALVLVWSSAMFAQGSWIG